MRDLTDDIACSARGLSAEGLTLCGADGQLLLDRVGLTLDARSITVVMGPNGAGKSLLLRCLHGLVAPQAGVVRWQGRPLDDAGRRRQAMVFQKPVLLRRSVAANVDFALSARGRADPARRDALLARMGLLAQSRQPARLLSGGEAQRLALARALATDPEVLFLDEPTASLDPASALAIEEAVRDIHETGTKIVFVTHSVAQARRLGEDIVFMAEGRVCEHRPAARFFAAPESAQARAYLEGALIV